MADTTTSRLRITLVLVALGALAACGNNFGATNAGGSQVALDRNVVTGPVSDISHCSRFPSRC